MRMKSVLAEKGIKPKLFNVRLLNLRGFCHSSFLKLDYAHKMEEPKWF